MKRLFNPQIITAMLFAFTLMLTSCSDEGNGVIENNNDSIVDPTDDYTIKITPTNADSERITTITAEALKTVTVNVNFQSPDEKMSRLYITRNEYGSDLGVVAYSIPGTDTKKDGSIDVSNSTDRKNINLSIPFVAPADANGTVVYTLWMTKTKGLTSRGDFRDPSKRNALSEDPAAVGMVIIEAGSGSKLSGDGINSFSAVILAAPLADGSSQTFISIFNGEKYKINQGEEFASFWDFGYYWLKADGPSLASAATYNTKIVDITTLTGVAQEELNKCYFKKSTKTAAQFDAITSFDELNKLTVSASDSQKITNLAKGTVVEFIDQFGNKGLLKITNVVGGYGSDGKIEFDAKVQQNVIDPFNS